VLRHTLMSENLVPCVLFFKFVLSSRVICGFKEPSYVLVSLVFFWRIKIMSFMAEYSLNGRLLEKCENNTPWIEIIIKVLITHMILGNTIIPCRVIRTLTVVQI
jgi:hypothetical protein